MSCKCILPSLLLSTIQDSFGTISYNKIFKVILCLVSVYYPLYYCPPYRFSFGTETYDKIFKALLCLANVYYPKYYCPPYRIHLTLKPMTKSSRLYYVL